jgi:regulator of nonsense transcripts 1
MTDTGSTNYESDEASLFDDSEFQESCSEPGDYEGLPITTDIRPCFNDTPFTRRLYAIETLQRLNKKGYIDSRMAVLEAHILGLSNFIGNAPVFAEHVIPGTRKSLDVSQRAGVARSMASPFTIMQGPPGTGKTTTIGGLCYYCREVYPRAKSLVCGPSNASTDELARAVNGMMSGAKVVRYSSLSTRKQNPFISHIDAYNIIESRCPEWKRLRDLKKNRPLNRKEKETFRRLLGYHLRQVLDEADVICCTTSMAGSKVLNGRFFNFVIIDEAMQAKESECLVPFLHATDKMILVGDHKQLSPMVMCPDAENEQPLFERLIECGMSPFTLEIQYRMHPELSEFPSREFYEGRLRNGVTAKERTPWAPVFPWPNKSVPLALVDTDGREEQTETTKSFYNHEEAMRVVLALRILMKNGVNPSTIGVITPYAAQKEYIRSIAMQSEGMQMQQFCREVQVASVDAFQGSEKEYIIMCTVRNNSVGNFGFTNDPRRVNVALTRARRGLIVIGSAKFLRHDPLWRRFVHHCDEKGLIHTGALPM